MAEAAARVLIAAWARARTVSADEHAHLRHAAAYDDLLRWAASQGEVLGAIAKALDTRVVAYWLRCGPETRWESRKRGGGRGGERGWVGRALARTHTEEGAREGGEAVET